MARYQDEASQASLHTPDVNLLPLKRHCLFHKVGQAGSAHGYRLVTHHQPYTLYGPKPQPISRAHATQS